MMNKVNPIVSAVIPTYNRAVLLPLAIQSALDQTFKDIEIIIVDDGSTDNTEEVVRDFVLRDNRVKYFRHEKNRGGATARNTGISSSNGDFIAFLDSDDLWFPQKIEKQIAILNKYENINIVYSNIVKIDAKHNIIGMGFSRDMFPNGYIFNKVLLRKAACFYLQTLLVRKVCFDRTNYFDIEFKKAHDRDMILRLAKNHHMYGIAEPLTKFKQHEDTQRLTHMPTEVIEFYNLKVIEKLFKTYGKDLDTKLKKHLISNHYLRFGLGHLRKENNIIASRKNFKSAISYKPFNIKAYIYFVATLFGMRGLTFVRLVKSKYFCTFA